MDKCRYGTTCIFEEELWYLQTRYSNASDMIDYQDARFS